MSEAGAAFVFADRVIVVLARINTLIFTLIITLLQTGLFTLLHLAFRREHTQRAHIQRLQRLVQLDSHPLLLLVKLLHDLVMLFHLANLRGPLCVHSVFQEVECLLVKGQHAHICLECRKL